MPGKYTKFRKKLKRFVNPDPSFQEKVRKAKVEILGEGVDLDEAAEAVNIVAMGAQLADATRAKDHLEEEVSELNIKIEALKQILTAAMEDEVEKFALADGGSVNLKDEVYVSISDKVKLFKYLKKVYKKDVIEMLTLHHQTLQSLGKAQLLAGKAQLPGTQIYGKLTARYTRPGQNGGGNEGE